MVRYIQKYVIILVGIFPLASPAALTPVVGQNSDSEVNPGLQVLIGTGDTDALSRSEWLLNEAGGHVPTMLEFVNV